LGEGKGKIAEGIRMRMQAARRKNKKGRAAGGMILGIRKELMEKEKEERKEVEDVITGKIRYGKGDLRIVGVYVNKDIDRILVAVKEWMEGKGNDMKTIIEGILLQEQGKEKKVSMEEEEDEEMEMKSKDRKVNKEGRRLLEGVEERVLWGDRGGRREEAY